MNDCWFVSGGDMPTAECGVLTVPEDYSKPDGRKVKLPFIIYRANEPNASTSPLVITGGGGPGVSLGVSEQNKDAFSDSFYMHWYASTIDAGRDLILIDNRGVGSSIPRLTCPEVTEVDLATLGKHLTVADVVKLTKESYSACRNRLIDQDIDISQYQIINSVEDLEELRKGLRVEQFNVYGASYGTRVSLEYERRYPNSVRTLILDGVYPQSVITYESDSRLSSEAMLRVIKKCEENKSCFDKFGFNFAERLTAFLNQLDNEPVTVHVTNPVDYSSIKVLVTPDVFFDSLYNMMYDANLIAYMPKYLYATFRGSTDYLTEMVRDYYVSDLLDVSFDVGAYASYSCFDEIPFSNYDVARNALNKYPFQYHSNKYTFEMVQAMCEAWDVPIADREFKVAYKIDTPVLIYSGELDPVTPAELADIVAKSARKSWRLKWTNIAHGVMFSSDCSDWTAQEFLSDPESDPFIYECSDEKPEFEFAI